MTLFARVSPFDTTDYLGTLEEQAEYLTSALGTEDASHFLHALGVAARTASMVQVAEDVGLDRESLYKALRADSHPDFATVVRVLHALGLRLTAEPDRRRARARSAS